MNSINTSLTNGLNGFPRPTHSEIARSAAQLWEKRGRPAHCDEEIWLEAEQLLLIARGDIQPRPTRMAQPKPAGKERSKSSRLSSPGLSSPLSNHSTHSAV